MAAAVWRSIIIACVLGQVALPAWADEASDLLQRADALNKAGNASDAEAVLSEGVIRFPKDASLHLRYGRLLDAQELNGLARAHYRAAVVLQPDNADALATLGHSLISAWESEEAQKLLQKALAIQPNHVGATWDMARLNLQSFPDAVTWYDRALKLDPTNNALALDYAQFLQMSNHSPEAARLYEGVLTREPDNTHALFQLGRMLAESKQDRERGLRLMTQAFEKVLPLKGDEEEFGLILLTASLSAYLEEDGRLDDIAGLGRRMIEVRPDLLPGYMIVAATRAKQKRWADAEAVAQELRKAHPESAAADRTMAGIEGERGRWPQAKAWFQKAVTHTPNDSSWRRDFGDLAEKNGDLPLAIAQYRQELRLEPKSAETYLRLAKALLRTGPKAKPEAKKLLQQAVEKAGPNDEVKALLQKL